MSPRVKQLWNLLLCKSDRLKVYHGNPDFCLVELNLRNFNMKTDLNNVVEIQGFCTH